MGFLDKLLGALGAGGAGAVAGGMPAQSRSQRDFPGQTNYGVPEDNMIDQMGGYVTRQQYDNNMMNNGFLRNARYEDEGFVGNPRSMNQYSPLNADVRSFAPGSWQTPDLMGTTYRTGHPMGFTGGQGFRPQYGQEGLANLQGGAPNFNSFGMQYPEGTRNSRLRVR